MDDSLSDKDNPCAVGDFDCPSSSSVILVLGMHRSGTSAISGVLGKLGAEIPVDILPPIVGENSSGYWESASIVANHNRLLKSFGLRWDMPVWSPIDQDEIFEQIDSGKAKADWVKLLGESVRTAFPSLSSNNGGGAPIVVKDPRMCRLVPLWKRVLQDLDAQPLFVLPFRNPKEVAASLLKRDGLEINKGLWAWLDHVLRAEFETRGCRRTFVNYSSLLTCWKTTLQRVGDDLGLDFSIDESAADVDAFLSSSLRHHFEGDDLAGLPSIVASTYREFDRAAKTGEEPDSDILDEAARDFHALCQLSGSWILSEEEEIKENRAVIEQLEQRSDNLVAELDREVKQHEQSKFALQEEIKSLGLAFQSQAEELSTSEQALREVELLLGRSEARANALLETIEKQGDELDRVHACIAQEKAARAAIEGELAQAQDRNARLSARAHMLSAQLEEVLGLSNVAFAMRKLRAGQCDAPSGVQVCGRRIAFLLRMARLSVRPGGLASIRQIRRLMGDPSFDLVWYRDSNEDVLRSGLHPAEHFVLFGQAEGRAKSFSKESAKPRLVSTSDGNSSCQLNDRLVEEAKALASFTQKTFSIVMPTWNRKEIISRAIESILKQSFEGWQLIIADDGSADGTEAYLKDAYGEYFESGQMVFLSGEHQGVSATRNRALNAATGDWIAYLDSDNEWHEHYLLITAASYLRDQSLRTAYASLSVDDRSTGRKFVRAQPFNWAKLAKQNFIDLNIFSHDRGLFCELGGFDESLSRLVDWDLILRYTKHHAPKFNSPVLANYYIDNSLSNISLTEPLDSNKDIIDRSTLWDRIRFGSEPLRLAYVLWDYPALSQTFVLREIKWMIQQGHDVKVYYKATPDKSATIDFEVDAYRVKDHRELGRLLVEHQRNWAHTHFMYPAATLLLWPACEAAGIPFSIMPHAVDIFHHENRTRNLVAEISSSDLCKKIVVYGPHHRDFLIEQGAPPEKFIFTLQASDAGRLATGGVRRARQRSASDALRIVSVGRFIEKKGFGDLLEAVRLIQSHGVAQVELTLFGYGPLEPELRAFCKKHRLNNVRFASTFEGADGLCEAFEHADVFCLPCVESENGDVDGFPTVFIEAAWYGLPILTTTVSAIPDYLKDGFTASLVPPHDPKALARTIESFARSAPAELEPLARRAFEWASRETGPDRTGQRLLDVINRPPIDIFMVTYHPDGLDNWERTDRAIESVLSKTTTPFRLTIVDNASDPLVVQKLQALVAKHPATIRLVALDENIGCSPASNIAVSMAQSDLVMYFCSNEGYAVRVGWERALIERMRDCPGAAMGGQLVHSPAWSTGEGLANHAFFSQFRNKEFAYSNPNRTFRHVQGGVWVLRRSVVEQIGGFNERVPQAGMDVEFSFYLESLGHDLLDISGVVSISNKTRPTIASLVDETTAVVHPVFDSDMKMVKACDDRDARRCNLCGWTGVAGDVAGQLVPQAFSCPSCESVSLDRAGWHWLARSEMCHRGFSLGVVNPSLFTERFFEAARNVQLKIFPLAGLNDPDAAGCDIVFDASCSAEDLDAYKVSPIDHCSQMLGIGLDPLRALVPQTRSDSSITVLGKAVDMFEQTRSTIQTEISP